MKTVSPIALVLGALLVFAAPRVAAAEADCLSCHGDKTLQDASGHSIGVDGAKFGVEHSRQPEMQRVPRHIKDYPHPDK